MDFIYLMIIPIPNQIILHTSVDYLVILDYENMDDLMLFLQSSAFLEKKLIDLLINQLLHHLHEVFVFSNLLVFSLILIELFFIFK